MLNRVSLPEGPPTPSLCSPSSRIYPPSRPPPPQHCTLGVPHGTPPAFMEHPLPPVYCTESEGDNGNPRPVYGPHCSVVVPGGGQVRALPRRSVSLSGAAPTTGRCPSRYPQALQDLARWLQEGKLQYKVRGVGVWGGGAAGRTLVLAWVSESTAENMQHLEAMPPPPPPKVGHNQTLRPELSPQNATKPRTLWRQPNSYPIQGGGEGQELQSTVRVTRTIKGLRWQ